MRRVVTIMVMLLVAMGCKRSSGVEERVEPTLTVDTENLELDYRQQCVEIRAESNLDIDVKEGVLWIAVSGVNDGVITLNIYENTLQSEREADIVITAGELSHTVHIVQMPKPSKSEMMELSIGHSDQYLDSPRWGGKAVSGTIEWGDGIIEEYSEGASHDYSTSELRTAVFKMEGATSFEIDRVGAMESLIIAVE